MIKKQASPADAPKEVDLMDDYEIKDHLNTLIKAHEIMNNPDKMAKVHELAGRHHKAITSLQDVKDHYQKKYGSGALKKLGAK